MQAALAWGEQEQEHSSSFHWLGGQRMGLGGQEQEQERCSESVMQRRANTTISLGVESSVGLGAALLIFIGVGVFAVGIAQAFQMERR